MAAAGTGSNFVTARETTGGGTTYNIAATAATGFVYGIVVGPNFAIELNYAGSGSVNVTITGVELANTI